MVPFRAPLIYPDRRIDLRVTCQRYGFGDSGFVPQWGVHRPRTLHAISLIEVLIALFCVLMFAVMIGSTVPVALRADSNNRTFAAAAAICAHKLRQCQAAGFTAMTGPLLGQNGRAIVDGAPSAPTSNSGGAATASFEFSDTEKLWQTFPSGSIPPGIKSMGGQRPVGTLSLAPYAPSLISGSGASAIYGLIQVTATVTWYDARGLSHTFAMDTLVPREAM